MHDVLCARCHTEESIDAVMQEHAGVMICTRCGRKVVLTHQHQTQHRRQGRR